ncbi:MAG: tetratricopeptide repeat protein [Helicobacteraceae bacterium]|jgi:tetratricopeptide (TPR) repeat protein|nr:tetratricopeptide repeat protein [Helicobacteraceae bacterium]
MPIKANAAEKALKLAKAAYEANKPQEAIAYYAQAISIDPNRAKTYNDRGAAYDNLGDYDRAIADYNLALEINPNDDGLAYRNRGAAYYKLGDYDNAVKDAHKALEFGDYELFQFLTQEKILRD